MKKFPFFIIFLTLSMFTQIADARYARDAGSDGDSAASSKKSSSAKASSSSTKKSSSSSKRSSSSTKKSSSGSKRSSSSTKKSSSGSKRSSSSTKKSSSGSKRSSSSTKKSSSGSKKPSSHPKKSSSSGKKPSSSTKKSSRNSKKLASGHDKDRKSRKKDSKPSKSASRSKNTRPKSTKPKLTKPRYNDAPPVKTNSPNVVKEPAGSQGDVTRGFLPGFGYADHADPELHNHHAAVKEATKTADQQCAQPCSNAERVVMVNQHYYNELARLESTLPQGPMEAMVHFEDIRGVTNFLNTPEVKASMDAIDQAVRDGSVSAIMPNQFRMAAPEFHKGMNPTQRLGVQNAVVLSSADEIIDSIADDDIGAGALALPYGGLGGTIAMRSRFDEGTLRHEANHAGEQALANIIGASDSSDFKNTTDREIAYETSWILADTFDQTVKASDCTSCSTLDTNEISKHVSTYNEVRAYLSGGNQSLQDALELGGLSSNEASLVADDLANSIVIKEQIDMINETAQIIMDSNL